MSELSDYKRLVSDPWETEMRRKLAAEKSRNTALLDDNARLRDRLTRAVHDLAEARDMVISWGAYADPYFQEKHGLETDAARLGIAVSYASEALSHHTERKGP